MNTTTIDLDRQRAEFEAEAAKRNINVERFKNHPDKYKYEYATQMWDFWQAAERSALARRSNTGEAAGIKTWDARQRESEYGRNAESCMLDEIAELRAALGSTERAYAIVIEQCRELADERATQQAARAQQEPVACRGCDPAEGFCRACREAEKRRLAAPVAQQSEAGAQDAARYRFLREHWVSFSAAPPLSNLHWKGDKLDAKVDAAILEGGAHG